jgi:hypothetical protein
MGQTWLMNFKDDRFIAKELSRHELETMETFAPAYFDYMSSAVSSNVSLSISWALTHTHMLSAPDSFGETFRMLQADLQENWKR